MAAIDRFIQDTLRDAGDRLITRQGQEISANLKSRTGTLLSGRRVSVSANRLTLTHPIYERFLDIKRLGKRKKRTRIHNRFVYGTYSSIAERLLAGFAEDVADTIKNR